MTNETKDTIRRLLRGAMVGLALTAIFYMAVLIIRTAPQPRAEFTAETMLLDAAAYQRYYKQCMTTFDDEPMCRDLAAEYAGE